LLHFARNDADNSDTSPRPRRATRPSCACIFRPEMEGAALPQEGSGECRCTRGRACRVVSTRVSHHGRTGITRHSRTRWFYGLFRALPGDRALLSPSLRGVASAKLDASVGASGPHDFAVRKPALSSAAPPASIASPPYVRDDRETPLCVGPGWQEM
jgi:hypothetical protein